jgi:hypothetical protein
MNSPKNRAVKMRSLAITMLIAFVCLCFIGCTVQESTAETPTTYSILQPTYESNARGVVFLQSDQNIEKRAMVNVEGPELNLVKIISGGMVGGTPRGYFTLMPKDTVYYQNDVNVESFYIYDNQHRLVGWVGDFYYRY